MKERVIKNKYIVLAPESTAGCKEWTYEGWCYLTDQLIKKGYEVVVLTTKPYSIRGAKCIHGKYSVGEMYFDVAQRREQP